MANTLTARAKHPYPQFEWFGKRIRDTEYQPVTELWGDKVSVSIDGDGYSTLTINPDTFTNDDAGTVFCRIGNPVYVVASGTTTHNPQGDGFSYVDTEIASIAVGALEFTQHPDPLTLEETDFTDGIVAITADASDTLAWQWRSVSSDVSDYKYIDIAGDPYFSTGTAPGSTQQGSILRISSGNDAYNGWVRCAGSKDANITYSIEANLSIEGGESPGTPPVLLP